MGFADTAGLGTIHKLQKYLIFMCKSGSKRGQFMEDGGVDRAVIDCRQNQLGQMANFLPLLTFSIFDL